MHSHLDTNLQFKSFTSLGRVLQGYVFGDAGSRISYVLVHGFGEHFMRYGKFLELMVSAGHTVAGLDLVGYGRSEGTRGNVEDYSEYINNLKDFLAQHFIAPRLDEETKLIGFSMGGNVVTQHLASEQLENKAYLVSPMFSLPVQTSANLQKVIDSVEKLVPNLNIYSGIIPPHELYKDGLAHANLTPQLARALLSNQGDDFIANLQTLPGEVVVIHSKFDPLCEFTGSQRFADSQPHAKLLEIDSMRHDLLLSDPEKIFALIHSY